MRRSAGIGSGYLVAALLMINPAVRGADDPKQQAPSEVVLKSSTRTCWSMVASSRPRVSSSAIAWSR